MVISSPDLQHTGERFLPWYTAQDPLTAYEHIHRYLFACRFAANKRVLDVSSGEGYGTDMLAHVATSVVGIDYDAPTIRHAQRDHHLPNAHYIRADARHFGLAAHSIDLAVSFETIEHLDGHEDFLASIKRALTADGVLLISTPHEGVYHDASGAKNPFHVRELALDEFRAVLEGHFRHVRFLGQKIIATSVIAATQREQFLQEGGPCCFAATEIDAEQHNFPVHSASDLDPRYYIAICSDAELPRIANSLMVDNRETLLRTFIDAWATLQHPGGDPNATHHQDYAVLQRTFVEQQAHLDHVTVLLSAVTEREQLLRASFLSAHVQLADRDDEIRRLAALSELLDSNRVALEDANEHQRRHICSLERHVAHLGDGIAEKEGHAAELERYVAHLGDEIARKDAYLGDFERRITHLGDEIAEKSDYIIGIERHVAHLGGLIVEERDRSTGFERYAIHLGGEIVRKDAYLGELERRVAHLGDEVAEKNVHAAELERYATHLGDEIADKSDYIIGIERYAAHLGNEIAEKGGHAAEIERYAAHLGDEIARRDAYLGELERQYREQSAWAMELQATLQQSTTAILLHRLQHLLPVVRPVHILRAPGRFVRLMRALVVAVDRRR